MRTAEGAAWCNNSEPIGDLFSATPTSPQPQVNSQWRRCKIQEHPRSHERLAYVLPRAIEAEEVGGREEVPNVTPQRFSVLLLYYTGINQLSKQNRGNQNHPSEGIIENMCVWSHRTEIRPANKELRYHGVNIEPDQAEFAS